MYTSPPLYNTRTYKSYTSYVFIICRRVGIICRTDPFRFDEHVHQPRAADGALYIFFIPFFSPFPTQTPIPTPPLVTFIACTRDSRHYFIVLFDRIHTHTRAQGVPSTNRVFDGSGIPSDLHTTCVRFIKRKNLDSTRFRAYLFITRIYIDPLNLCMGSRLQRQSHRHWR